MSDQLCAVVAVVVRKSEKWNVSVLESSVASLVLRASKKTAL